MPSRRIEILLVEDDPADAELVMKALRRGRLVNRVHHAETGDEALRFLFREGEHAGAPRPDLVLLDVHLPGTGGKEVLARIRNDETMAATPVVLLSASSADEDVLRSQQLPATAYATKPLTLRELLATVAAATEYEVAIVTPDRSV